jgi:hypothetical protein
MLLIDGVKFELWTPKQEIEEFHPIIKEHYKDIFGQNSTFIDGNKLESSAGKGSIPDGFVITLSDVPQWHIIEIELSTHQLYDHIVNQVGRFINGIRNIETQKKIIEAVYHYIQDNKQRKAEFEEIIGSGEIYKYISDLITKSPVLVIIIEKRTPELDEALNLLRYTPIKIIEFQTFTREGIGLPVHAHLLEPLYKSADFFKKERSAYITPQTLSPSILGTAADVTLREDYICAFYIPIPKDKKSHFPSSKTTLTLDTNIGPMHVGFNPASWGTRLQSGMKQWFKAHPELKVGDRVKITIIEPMKKYRLEIVK